VSGSPSTVAAKGIMSFIIGFFVFLLVAGLIVTMLRLLIFILPVLSVLGLVVLLVINIGMHDDSSTESQAEAARSLKTRSVLWFLPHDQGAV
jgi:hypothetical protein